MTIAEVSGKYDVSADTLRYYEKLGLLTAHRKESGIRDYSEVDLARLEFVKCMRDAGVSIEALQKYMSLMDEGDATIGERKQLLIEQREELKKRRDLISHSIERLDYKIANYEKLFIKKD